MEAAESQQKKYRIKDPNRRSIVDIRIPNYNTKEIEDLYAEKKESVDVLIENFANEGKDKIPLWKASTNVRALFFSYLLNKYNIRCGVYNTDILTTFSEVLTNYNAYEAYSLLVPVITMSSTQKKEYHSYLTHISEGIADCLKKDPISTIPINILIQEGKRSHANTFLVRPLAQSCEHFEPHGAVYMNNNRYANNINKAIKLLVDLINDSVKKRNLKLFFKHVSTANTCPEKNGPQAKECRATLKQHKKEGGGYCAAWSLLITELALINKSVSIRTIIEQLYKVKGSNLENSLKQLIRAFSLHVSNILETYYSNIFGKKMTIKEIIDKKNKIDSIYGSVLLDIEMLKWKFNITRNDELIEKVNEYYNEALEKIKTKPVDKKKMTNIKFLIIKKLNTVKSVIQGMDKRLEIVPVTKTKLYKLDNLINKDGEKCADKEKKDKEKQSQRKKINKTIKKKERRKKVIVDRQKTLTSVKSTSPLKESNKKLNLKELINKTDISAVKLIEIMIEHDKKSKK